MRQEAITVGASRRVSAVRLRGRPLQVNAALCDTGASWTLSAIPDAYGTHDDFALASNVA